MLFRSLSLLLPVALAFADTLVHHSSIMTPSRMFSKARAEQCLKSRGPVENVPTMSTLIMLRNCTTLIPDHVLSDTDGKWTCHAYTGGVTSTTEFMEVVIIAHKGGFQAVHFNSLSAAVYRSSPSTATYSTKGSWPLFRYAAYKACIERYYHAIAKEKERLVEAFCGKE
ncbi:hypothetical protein EDD85DRAFT_995406 [Armillaria nabsnona]|nr:hypothetical protein EDD85DRAFT_995406 [Armillaria nabsnona]